MSTKQNDRKDNNQPLGLYSTAYPIMDGVNPMSLLNRLPCPTHDLDQLNTDPEVFTAEFNAAKEEAEKEAKEKGKKVSEEFQKGIVNVAEFHIPLDMAKVYSTGKISLETPKGEVKTLIEEEETENVYFVSMYIEKQRKTVSKLETSFFWKKRDEARHLSQLLISKDIGKLRIKKCNVLFLHNGKR